MNPEQIVGIIPAAGVASRISPIPCSKEIFPVTWRVLDDGNTKVPKVIGHHLLDYMRFGGAKQVFIVIKEGKWDIPAYFKDGTGFDTHIAYLIADLPYGVPFTVNQGLPFLCSNLVLFGFPDILLTPANAFQVLVNKFKKSDADIVLGLFPVKNPGKWDIVKTDENGRVDNIDIKPVNTDENYAWAIACWGDRFTYFIDRFCTETAGEIKNKGTQHKDYHLGHCLKQAIKEDFRIETVKFPDGSCVDIGTPDDLQSIMETGASLFE